MRNNYPKKEKLCSKIIIEKLFETNQRLRKYPITLLWTSIPLPINVPAQSAVSVSKKRFKKAVTRNLLKRRMREAFRLHKKELYQTLQNKNIQIALMFIYQSNDILPFIEIEKSVIHLLKEIDKRINQV